jgi:hypothetical protein
MVQRGQGQFPLLRTVAIRILGECIVSEAEVRCEDCSLFGVVCRVCEYSRIESPFDTVVTFDNNAVLHGVSELIVQENIPLSMEHKAVAKGGEAIRRRPPFATILQIVFEGATQLKSP